MLITLEVTPDIAAKIRFMAESGVFAVDTGNVQLNFHAGNLKSIKTERYSYPQPDDSTKVDVVQITPIL